MTPLVDRIKIATTTPIAKVQQEGLLTGIKLFLIMVNSPYPYKIAIKK